MGRPPELVEGWVMESVILSDETEARGRRVEVDVLLSDETEARGRRVEGWVMGDG